MQSIAPHGAGLYKIVKMQDKPLVAVSAGHYSMGGEFTCLEMKGDKLHYIVENPFDCTIHYEILLPDGRVAILEIGKAVTGLEKDCKGKVERGFQVDLPRIENKEFNITDYGAVAGGKVSNTKDFADAIAAAGVQGGRGAAPGGRLL